MKSNVGSVWRRLLAGAALGLLWGVGMRGWMRFISTDPEFSWSGTLFIVGATTIAGALTGLGYHLSRRGKGWAWRLLGFSYVPLGLAAGGVMLPSAVVGGLAWGRSNWPRWLRLGLAAVAVGFQVVFFLGAAELPPGRTIPALLIYAFFLTIEAKAFSLFAAPRHGLAEVGASPPQVVAIKPS